MRASPKEAGFENRSLLSQSDASLTESLKQDAPVETTVEQNQQAPEATIKFLDAWKLPNVLKYAIVYMNCKSIIYALLLWLPYYLQHHGYEDVIFSIRS